MRNVKRISRLGDISFITSVTKDRMAIFSDRKNIVLFLQTLKEVQAIKKTNVLSYVILPDHVHLIIQSYEFTSSQIMHSLKWNFTQNWKLLCMDNDYETYPSHLWQSRFWERVLMNNNDLHQHIKYIINNPVKHGYVDDPEDWPYSSFAQNLMNNDIGFNEMEIVI